MTEYPISRRQRQALAVQADVDIRSIEAELRGERVAGRPGERARAAIETAGYSTTNATKRLVIIPSDGET